MVLKIASAVVTAILPTRFYLHIALALVALFSVHAIAQGRKTTRERDLHARVVLITGAFTPLGLTLVQALAKRGAHVIALTPDPITDPRIETLVDLIRASTANERVFAEQCDLARPSAVRDFCTKFVTGSDTRLDALVLAHEYAHLGRAWATGATRAEEEAARETGAMATFLLLTLLLPALLVAPVERDIRVVHLVNPFYAAGVPTFSPTASPTSATTAASAFVLEGRRALRGAVLTRHLQRVLDALPNRSQPPTAEHGEQAVPVVRAGAQRSNVVAVSVSPGVSRTDTVRRLLGAERGLPGFSLIGSVLYMILQPALRLLTKSPASAAQTVLHALFLPTPFKAVTGTQAGEVLKPGALYAECAVVHVRVPELPVDPSANVEPKGPEGKDTKGKAKEGEGEGEMPDDHELGGVRVGQAVWEGYEAGLKKWEQDEVPVPHGEGSAAAGLDTKGPSAPVYKPPQS